MDVMVITLDRMHQLTFNSNTGIAFTGTAQVDPMELVDEREKSVNATGGRWKNKDFLLEFERGTLGWDVCVYILELNRDHFDRWMEGGIVMTQGERCHMVK